MGRNLSNLYISQSFEYLVQISGSEFETGLGSTITSVNITASNAVSASFAQTASYALNAGTTVSTASLLTTASATNNVITFTKGDASTFAITVATGSAVTVNTGSLLVTASITNATTTFTKGDGTTFSLTANNVVNATSASFATFAVSSSNSATSISSSYSSVALSSSFATSAQTATSASFATNAATATSASFATNAATANSATSASFATSAATATTASFASTIASGLNITASNLLVNNNLTVNGTASFGYFEAVTGSVVRVGESFILLNTSDTTRYAGLLIEDSGSSTPINYTASWFYDSQTNDWNYEYNNAGDVDFAVALFGPAYDTKGTPTYLTTNKIPVASGSHHLKDSTITDNGTNVTFTTPIAGTQVSASTGFSGNLIGTASYATNAATASFFSGTVTNAISSSYPYRKGDGLNAVVAAYYSTSFAPNEGDLLIGGQNNKIISNRLCNAIVGGIDNTMSGNAGYAAGIFASYGSTISNGGLGTTIIGGYNNTFNENNVWGGIMLGGDGNTTNSNNGKTFILAGQSNVIQTGGSNHSGIAGGQSNIIDTSPRSAIIGGLSNTISNASNTIILGGSSITATTSNTVYVPNLIITGSATSITGSNVIGNWTDTYTGSAAIQQIVTLTQAEYNAISSSANPNTFYVISDSTAFNPSAYATTGSNTFIGNQIISGSLSVTGGITGSMFGTASFATFALGAGAANSATSASYALIADTAISASFATTALTASFYGGTVTSASYAVTGGGLIAGAATAIRSAPYLTSTAATASGANSIALGSGAYTLGGGTVAIGTATQAQALRSVAIGNTALASGANSVAIGYNITSSASNGVNINGAFIYDGAIKLPYATQITGSLRGQVTALTITANTASLNCATNNFFTLTLVSGSNTFINPSNIQPGQTINLQVTQANPGNGTISFPTSVKQVSGSSYVPSTGAGPVDIVTFISFDASSLYLSNVKNLV